MNADPSSPDPLSDDDLARVTLDIPRHETPSPEPVVATYDIITSRGSEPQVDLEPSDGGNWRLRVTLEEGSARDIRPAAPEVVVVRRDELLELPADDLIPSLPENWTRTTSTWGPPG